MTGIRPDGLQEGTIGGSGSTPLTPVQKMRVNLQWLRERGSSTQEQQAEIERWKPKIDAYNRRERADAGSYGNLAAQALTFNAGDEIAGAADAVGAMVPGGVSPGQAYRDTRNAVAGTNTALRQEEPGKSLAVELGTGLAAGAGTGVAAARALPGVAARGISMVNNVFPATRIGRLGRNVTLGTTAGAAAGAAGADPGLDTRLRGAGIGAATGAAVAGGLQAAGGLVGATARRVGFGPRAPDTRIGAVQSAIGAETADVSAANRIAERVRAGGREVEDVLTDVNPDLTPGAMLADINTGGQHAARLAGTAKRLGVTAAERVETTMGSRARDRGTRMGSELTRISGTPSFNIDDEADRLITEARAASKPLYAQLKQFAAVPDARIAEAVELIPEDRLKGFWQGVQDIARMDGRRTRGLLDEHGKLAFDLEPSEMDDLKKALDEVIYSGTAQAKARMPGGLSNAQRNLLLRARSLIVGAAEDATGGPDGVYAQARRAYGGPVAIREALEAGEVLPRLHADEIPRATRDLSPSERQAFAAGGTQALRRDIETATEGQTGVARRLTSPKRRAQVDAALNDPGKSEAWNRMLAGEQARERTEGIVMRGSPTAERLADDELATLPINPRQGLVASAVDAMKGPLERAVLRGTTGPEMDAVARVLTEDIGDAQARARVLKFVREGKKARADMAAKEALRRAGLLPAATAQRSESRP